MQNDASIAARDVESVDENQLVVTEGSKGTWERQPNSPSWSRFYSYTSKAHVHGFPVLHVVSGKNPRTQTYPRPRGIVAIGTFPIGIIAIGNVPLGVVSIGNLSLGFLAIGTFAIGVLGIGVSVLAVAGLGMFVACLVGVGQFIAGIRVVGQLAASP